MSKNPDTEWRAPFPYFLGSNTWLVFHTLVNIGKLLSENGKNKLISIFSNFIASFIPTYSCSGCITQFNLFVIVNDCLPYYQAPLDDVTISGIKSRLLSPLYNKSNPSLQSDEESPYGVC